MKEKFTPGCVCGGESKWNDVFDLNKLNLNWQQFHTPWPNVLII